MWWSKTIALCALLALGACGFEPLYGGGQTKQGVTFAELSKICVDPIDHRAGQLVRNHLADRLTPTGRTGPKRYRLGVNLVWSSEGLALARDETVTRYNVQLEALFTLTDTATGRKIFGGTARSIAVYNVVDADYSTLTAERDSERRAVREVSDEITTRLSVFFSSPSKKG